MSPLNDGKVEKSDKKNLQKRFKQMEQKRKDSLSKLSKLIRDKLKEDSTKGKDYIPEQAKNKKLWIH